ncbi:TonB-dependent siderophore receptor [Rhodoferax sp. PAMC 29310]|uniref:TonB-dependent receptor plug domain-containing protein n=1 Tax=Rhodoferax sp. PAMC 29310 TaxID=2822760 RepID=UPI001B31D491|nr:TonB-dependent receptor [Rhodoferax sp. PAMC 29310]
MNRSVFLSIVLGWAGSVCAQMPDALSEKDFFTEMPIVLSVSRLPQRLDDTPGAVTILDRDMIRLSGARDVADLLRLVPGFQTSSSFETGAPVASYHGGFDSYSARIQVLVDGRSTYSPFLFGGVGPGLQAVALQDIERIEVLRGSNSAAYGARAMLGVINIVTRHTLDTQGAQASVGAGENGVRDVQARIGWGTAQASYRLTVDRRADEGLAGSNGHNAISRVNLRADLRASAQDEFQFRAGTLSIDAGKGFAGRANDPRRDRYFGSGFAQLDWRRTLNKNEDVALTVSHTEESHRDNFLLSLQPYGYSSNVVVDFGGRATNDSLMVQHTWRASPAWSFVWGGELRREEVESKPLYGTGTPFVTNFTRLFGNAEWKFLDDFVLNSGAMLEYSSASEETFAPRVMLNWHLAPGHTLRAGISKAYRPPSTYEKFGNTRYYFSGQTLAVITASRGNIDAESLVTRELGYLASLPRLGLELDVRAFEERIRGFVRQVSYSLPAGSSLLNTKALDYVNSEDFTIQGVEYQLGWRPWRDAKLVLGQAFTDVRSRDPGSAKAAPQSATTLMLTQRLSGGIDLSLMHQNSSTVTPQGAGIASARAMMRTDLRLGIPMRWGRQKGEVALVVQNLGLPFMEFDNLFRFERRAFVTLRIEN